MAPKRCAALAFAGALALVAQPAAARGNSKAERVDKDVLAAQTLLQSQDHDEIETGIQSLGLLGTPAAVDPIIKRVRAGLPPDLLETSIVTLMALGQPQAAPLYFDLVEYRRPEIRLRAIEAIVALKPKGAEPVLQRALSDGDQKVRSAAALALGELHATSSIELLFQALDRGTFEASQAIGQALQSEQVPRLLGYLGQIPFHSLAPAFTEVLQRKDVAERDKLTVVSRLQDVGTREVKDYFADLNRASADKLPPPVHRAVLRAMQEIAD
ncbi:MAG: HEAT repeat domain-containing protein [Polyangiales bacterium]